MASLERQSKWNEEAFWALHMRLASALNDALASNGALGEEGALITQCTIDNHISTVSTQSLGSRGNRSG